MYLINIGHEPSMSIVGSVTGRTVKEVRKNFLEWKTDRCIRANDGNYFLCWKDY